MIADNVRSAFRALLLWSIAGLVLVIGIPVAIEQWGSFPVYEWYLNTIVLFGFICSVFVTVTWTPYIIRARRRGPLNVSVLAIVDFATLAYLGVIVFGLRAYLTMFVGGTPVPDNPGRAVLSLAIWTLVAIKVGLRAYIWRRAMRRGPLALDDVTDHVRAPLTVVEPDNER